MPLLAAFSEPWRACWGRYGVTWPMLGGNATQKDYNNPKGTVYITEGNGGVLGAPGKHAFTYPKTDWMRSDLIRF